MNLIKWISCILSITMLAGCATSNKGLSGAAGPKLTSSGQMTESGQYVEVGVQFSTVGDFVALVSPSRWKSPVSTGGSFSWLSPKAWSEDASRTSRILLGEVVLVGGVAVAAVGAGGGSGDDSESSAGDPPPPEGGGGGVLPIEPLPPVP